MGSSMKVRIGPVVKLGQFGIETNEVKYVKGCPNCKIESNDRFCKDCGSAIITFETYVKNDIENPQQLLWEISSTNRKFEDEFYTTEDAEDYIVPNFRISNTYIIDDYSSPELILVPTIEEQNEAISDVMNNDAYKTLKEFCDKHHIECDVIYAIFSYWS